MFIIQAATTLVILFVYVITLLTPIFCPKVQQANTDEDGIEEDDENVMESNLQDLHGA